ncbi:replicative helicase loader/inhibitor [Desulfotomaculum sp. 1211_IL3151]|uniref:replicative helicase loader/inhibitor n=1 Tax=Desulfotomaculum sp. 1211_IL3151 TaxID=3084055 RepID=UPI002FD9C130
MNLEQAINLVGLALANFPNMQERDMAPTAVLWEKLLSDIPYHVAEKALVKVLATAKFFPAVAEIREAAIQLTQPVVPTALEAWGEVTRAMRLYGYYRPEEALASLSPITAEVVRRFGWRDMCACEEPEVLRGQFRMAYEQYAGRQREMAVLPSGIRELIGGLADKLTLGGGEDVPNVQR